MKTLAVTVGLIVVLAVVVGWSSLLTVVSLVVGWTSLLVIDISNDHGWSK